METKNVKNLKHKHQTNFEYLIDGYSRETKQNIPNAINKIILLYHPQMNGYEFKWKLNINSLDKSFDSNEFDVGLSHITSNKYFLRAKKINSMVGSPPIIGITLMSFPLASKIGSNARSIIIHCQFYCQELNEQYSKICSINNPIASTTTSSNNPFEINKTNWNIFPNNKTNILTIECTLNILKISAIIENNNSYSIYPRSNRNNNKNKNIVLYNYHILNHKTDMMQFTWNLYHKNIHMLNKSQFQIISGIFHNMFQFVAWKKVNGPSNTNNTNPIHFGIRICGLPPNAHSIGVKIELSFYNTFNNEIKTILSRIESIGYDKPLLFLDSDQNKMLSKQLFKFKSLKLFCKANIVARYGINNNCLSIKPIKQSNNSSNSNNISNNKKTETDIKITETETEKETEIKSQFISMKSESFVWNITDALMLTQIKTRFPSNSGLSSDPFELHEHQWYITIQSLKQNRYLAAPSISEQNSDHKQIKISIDCLGFSTRESMDCKVSISILQNGLKSTFYQKFPGRYLRDKEDTYLECSPLSLAFMDKVSIKIEIRVVNHKDDDILSLKESIIEKKKQKEFSEEVKDWLCNVVGLPDYVNVFRNNNVNNMEIIKLMTKDDMKCIGVNKIGDRIILWKYIQLLIDKDSNGNENEYCNDECEGVKQNKKNDTNGLRKRKHEMMGNGNEQYGEPLKKKARVSVKNGNVNSKI